ncbi:MAG: DUF2974 domain-containing protein [Anaerofustis sp.]
MKNIIDYVQDETRTFAERPLGSVDSLIFSQLSYLNFEGYMGSPEQDLPAVLLKDLAAEANREPLCEGVRAFDRNVKLLQAIENSPRFSNIGVNWHICRIDTEREEQFSATTFLFGDGTAYVAFRGTDATLVGWKEDFNMAFSDAVPAQLASAEYLNLIGKKTSGTLYVGGHSKGGNLAVYAAMHCKDKIRSRIAEVFSHDGPGFREGVFGSEEYARVKPYIRPTMPQSSIVGMLLEQHESYSVVKSAQIGIMQHDPFTWLIKDDDFHYLEELDSLALFNDKVIQTWLNAMTDSDRERFVDALFGVAESAGVSSFADLSEDFFDKAKAAMDAVRDLDDDTSRFVSQTLKYLVTVSVRNLKPDISLSSMLQNVRESELWKKFQ